MHELEQLGYLKERGVFLFLNQKVEKEKMEHIVNHKDINIQDYQ